MVAPTFKLIGVTTNGESANTGLTRELWKLMNNWLHNDLLALWCSVHKSDLAFKSTVGGVSELRIWIKNANYLATFFRNSKKKLNFNQP